MTDMCTSGGVEQGDATAPPMTNHPWVWLGSPLAVGTVELPNDFVQETVEVNGVRVTVGDDDPEELATMLGSLEPVDVDANGCEASTRVPEPSAELGPASTSVESVSVCAYRHGEDGSGVTLGYSTTVSGAAAQRVFDAIKEMPEVVLDCDPTFPPRLDDILLRFHGDQGDVDVLVRLDGCGGYYTGEGVRLFTHDNVTPWVVDGIGLYASGGMVGNAISGFYDRYGG
jgi:hypothetical protein